MILVQCKYMQDDLTFVGWIEDILKTPTEYPKKSVALYYNSKRNVLTTWIIKSNQALVAKDSDIAKLLTMSDDELFELKGVTTVVDIPNTVKHPIKTLTTMGKKTVQDILNATEITSDRRAKEISALVHGQTQATSIRGSRDVTQAPGGTFGTINKVLGGKVYDMSNYVENIPDPSSPSGFRTVSKMTLRGTIKFTLSPTDKLNNEDRKSLEEFKIFNDAKYLDKQYKPYAQMASSMEGLAAYADTVATRERFRREIISAHNKAILSELGVDLDKILPTKTGKKAKVQSSYVELQHNGRLVETLVNNNVDIKTFLSNSSGNLDKRLSKLLGINVTKEMAGPLSKIIYAEYLANNLDMIPQALGGLPPSLGGWSKAYDKQNILTAHTAKSGDALKIQKRQDEMDKALLEAQFSIEAQYNKIKSEIYKNQQFLAYKKLLKAETKNTGLGINSIPAARKAELRNKAKDVAQMSTERIMAAQTGLRASHNLFFASTTKDLLRAVEDGDYMKVAMITSKFAGQLPFIKVPFMPSDAYLGHYLDPLVNTVFDTFKVKEIKSTIGKVTGLNFQSESKALRVWGIENRVAIEWKNGTGANTTAHIAWIKAKDAEGIFGINQRGKYITDFSVYDVVKRSWGGNDLGTLIQGTSFAGYSPNDLFKNPTLLNNFLNKLNTEAYNLVNGLPATDLGMATLARALGLDSQDALNLFQNQLSKFHSNGSNLLAAFLSRSDITNEEIWNILNSFYSSGKYTQLAGNYIGLLNAYNRGANYVRNFFYKQLLWGQYGGSNRLLLFARNSLNPVRGILESFGMSAELGIAGSIENLFFMQQISQLANYLKTESLANILSGLSSSFGGKILSKFVTENLLRTAGYLLSGLSGILSGGISWLITSLGDVAWQFFKNLYKGLDTAVKAALESLKGTGKVILKVIIYPLIGCVGCMLVPIFFIASVIAYLNNDTSANALAEPQAKPEFIKVEKTAHKHGSQITYKVKITNITGTQDSNTQQHTVTIQSFDDKMTYIPDCGQTPIVYDDIKPADFPGTTSISLKEFEEMFINHELEPNNFLEHEYTLNIPPDVKSLNATYSNIVEITVSEAPTVKEAESVTTNINNGGCIKCPSGWPLTNSFILSQGPYRHSPYHDKEHSHAYYKSEAVDLATKFGNPIYATHAGTISVIQRYNGDRTGYGKYVFIHANTAGYNTIYAHMSAINSDLQVNQPINKGDLIGYVGNTGNSNGNHLHYEFKPNTIECIPGKPLHMENLNDSNYIGSYIPVSHNIDDCYGPSECEYTGP